MFALDLKLPKLLFTAMLYNDPNKRCTLNQTICIFVDALSKVNNLDNEILVFIEHTKSKYDPNYKSTPNAAVNANFMPGFTHYLKEAA
ncbi:MAG TPA: hypothetical protein PLD88_13745, partial [Candidatus Berkiella sp.]|nr:hypothetical protein [Candidatus Berkiella sp.]